MSKPLRLHAHQAADITVVVDVPGVGIMLALGPTPPAENAVGYGKHALFLHTDGADLDAAVYLNVGTKDAANFDPLNLTI